MPTDAEHRPGWQREVDLESFNTLAVPAIAERFCQVRSVEQLRASLSSFREAGFATPLILGGGSNMVLTQTRYPAVIHLQLQGITFGNNAQISVAAGENWHGLVMKTLDRQLYGLENLALIPGSCGAAPIQNIGAYGVEAGEFITAVSAVHRTHGELRRFSAAACGFAYRDSFFKSAEGRNWIVVAVDMQLNAVPKLNLAYTELASAWRSQDDWLSPAERALANEAQRLACLVAALRRSKLPDPAETPNAGSFFKNPVVDATVYAALQQRCPDVIGYPLADGRVKLAAGWLIDQAGHKGRVVDGLGMHARQALVLVNPGHHRGEAVLAFASTIQADILEKFGVKLEIEPDQY